jgi:hypothetical protein
VRSSQGSYGSSGYPPQPVIVSLWKAQSVCVCVFVCVWGRVSVPVCVPMSVSMFWLHVSKGLGILTWLAGICVYLSQHVSQSVLL